MIFTTTETLQDIRARIRAGEGDAAALSAWMRQKADEAAAAPTACLTDRTSPAASGDPHDYFSEGPYWWPDPENPGGSYIHRDGYMNPERFEYHYDAMCTMFEHALALTLAAYHLDEPRYADTAREKLRRFFLDPATRMNPNLNHGQAIRGHCDGRGIGIIDARDITQLIFAVELLELMNPADETAAGVKAWLGEFYQWLRTSKHGIEERVNGNNHSTYYTMFTMSLARLLGDEAGFAADCDYTAEMLAKQMAPSGEFPAETARTKSFVYSCMNLVGFALLCEIARFGGVDLWNRDCGGARMSTAVRWLAQYIVNPADWPYPSIALNGDATLAMLAGSARLEDDGARTAAKDALTAALAEDPLREISPFGPAALWFAR